MNQNIKEIIASRVIGFYAENPPVNDQIVHTQCVANYTRLIAVEENLDQRGIDMMEVAAWLHDIGCPLARAIYGKCLPKYQEDEGRKVVAEWLADSTDFTKLEKRWLTDVVGNHHQQVKAKQLGFEPLFDADVIVNMWEGYHKRENAQMFYDKVLLSESGKRYFKMFFLNGK